MIPCLEILALAMLPAFLVLDLLYGHRRAPRSRWWRLRGLLVSAFTIALSMAVALGWGHLLAGRSLFDLSGLGLWAGAALGVLVYEFGHYWYHRTAHRSPRLWRASHQMHHSAETLDAFGAYYLHPIDTLVFTTIQSVVFFPLLGVAPEAGATAAAFLAFNAAFQHADLRTPRWLGWFIQRPESHLLHHQRGVHAYNYADLPLWDIVFGTFRNPPAGYHAATGLGHGASARLGDLLLGRDVDRTSAAAAESAMAEART
ncbi:sterol desaturase family protein [Luteimonas sp. RD2P54]|uniref:Sterol desaturase family protein n=1 Tax=Luteimonas endophytica TaxID=3042023 RepID=A0ABT6J566_9GAMM|nr:sterol desaturase family protein [Luteimonas endophytica]MDH5821955.1 sterol desaturase family protein [Luteimonas endophytica]